MAVAKYQLFRKYGVAEYWLVDREKQSIEMYRLQDSSPKLIGVFTGADELTTQILPGFSFLASQVGMVPPLFNPSNNR